jgi:hypothetical protein
MFYWPTFRTCIYQIQHYRQYFHSPTVPPLLEQNFVRNEARRGEHSFIIAKHHPARAISKTLVGDILDSFEIERILLHSVSSPRLAPLKAWKKNLQQSICSAFELPPCCSVLWLIQVGGNGHKVNYTTCKSGITTNDWKRNDRSSTRLIRNNKKLKQTYNTHLHGHLVYLQSELKSYLIIEFLIYDRATYPIYPTHFR